MLASPPSCRTLTAPAALGLSTSPAIAPAADKIDPYDGVWHFTMTPYPWLPKVNGTLDGDVLGSDLGNFSVSTEIGPNDYLQNLKFGAMVTGKVRKGDWAVFTDIIYIDFGDQRSNVRNITGNFGSKRRAEMTTSRMLVTLSARSLSAVVLFLTVVLGASMTARADEADAKRLLKAMSDYVAAREAISFAYDAVLEVVTKDEQILALASSGTVTLNRPDKILATRYTGFADVEMSFDGKTLTVLGKNLNIYAQQDVPGTVDNLVDALRKHNRPLPAADLLLTDPYEVLMKDVVDIKDLGSGVIGGVECDYLAFRAKEVDWQIWIAQGERPYPCRYVISSKFMDGEPQYSIQVRDWKASDEVAATDFSFTPPADAKKVDLKDLEGTDELPRHFEIGEAQ